MSKTTSEFSKIASYAVLSLSPTLCRGGSTLGGRRSDSSTL